MAESYKKLHQSELTTSAAVVYTVPANTQTIVKHIRAVNSDATVTYWVSLWDGGSSDANLILPQTDIVAGGFFEIEATMCMDAGGTLQAQAQAATTITLTVYGLEIS